MRQYEADTWYDQNGRIVFTNSKGLPGVGFPRPEWNTIKDMKSGTVQRQITDNTLPTGPIDRTLTYQAPFTLCNREQDYAQVWAVLDAIASESVPVRELTETEIPNATRIVGLTPEHYLLEFLPQVFKIAGEPITLDHLLSHYLILTDLKARRKDAKQVIGTNSAKWISGFNQETDIRKFRTAFDKLWADSEIAATSTGLLRWNKEAYGVDTDQWINCDARFVGLLSQAAPEKMPQLSESLQTEILSPLKEQYQVA